MRHIYSDSLKDPPYHTLRRLPRGLRFFSKKNESEWRPTKKNSPAAADRQQTHIGLPHHLKILLINRLQKFKFVSKNFEHVQTVLADIRNLFFLFFLGRQ